MSTDETSSRELGKPRPPDASRGPAIFLIVTLLALAALVWELKPDRPNVHPAPLQPQTTTCPQVAGPFTPTSITDLPGLDLASLSKERRNHVLQRLNMEPCSCGCNASVASCVAGHERCGECRQRAKEIIAEEQETTP